MTEQPRNQRNKRPFSKPVGTGMVSLQGEMSEATKQMAIRHHFIYSTLGLMLGLVCMVLGTFLFFNGIGGSASWTAKVLGMDSQLSDAGPGALLFVVGLFIVGITRFSVKVQK